MITDKIQNSLNENEQPDYIKNQILELDRRLELSERGETKFFTWEEIQRELAAMRSR